MRPRRFAAALVVAAALLSTPAVAVAAPPAIGVTGDVGAPGRYTAADLVALGQSAYPVTNPSHGTPATVTGTSLYALAVKSAPAVPPGKNTALRVTMRVTGRHGETANFALGELDPGFGNHPAVLVTSPRHGIGLIVPGDRNRTRSVTAVAAVRINVSTASAQDVAAGAVLIVTPHGTRTLPAWVLKQLPSRDVRVTFLMGTTPQTHTESGPPLSLVLLAAGVLPRAGTSVVAVGTDGYGAAVTLGEDYVGGRPLLLSTVEDGVPLERPRLIPDGDVKGGRYVSATVTLAVG
ncbi:hypothetical protein AB5J62_23280 [Amycolatopsis sp. cg5]|uniref:hypothetical protein n=1 Tax=Amycolatopsis sp. cg5 TaxID=3238802 RepID=UPI003523F27C